MYEQVRFQAVNLVAFSLVLCRVLTKELFVAVYTHKHACTP